MTHVASSRRSKVCVSITRRRHWPKMAGRRGKTFTVEEVAEICADSGSESDPFGDDSDTEYDCDVEEGLDTGERAVEAMFPAGEGKKHKQKKCRVCQKKGKRRDSRYFCVKCKVTLCPDECFNVYHSERKYY